MGGTESSDKEKDMTVKEHLKDMFRSSPYKDMDYPTSSKDDYRYGPCEFIEISYDRIVVRKRLRIKDDRQFQTYLKNKKERINFDQNLFVKLLDFDCGAMTYEDQEDGTYKFYIDCYFEFYQNDLRKEIARRKSDDQHYSSTELKELLDFFIKAGTTLDVLNSRHSDLRPEFICLTPEGKPVLMDNVRDKAGAGARLAFVSDIDKYTCPILYKHYCRNIMKVKHDKPKDDVFSAGLIILEAGLLQSIQKIYDPDQARVRTTILAELIEKFEERYSNSADLCQTVRSMLTIEETDRPYFKEIKLSTGRYAAGGGMTSNPSAQQQPRGSSSGPSGGYGTQSKVQGYGQPQPSGYGQNRPNNPLSNGMGSSQSGFNPLSGGLGQTSTVGRPSYGAPGTTPARPSYTPGTNTGTSPARPSYTPSTQNGQRSNSIGQPVANGYGQPPPTGGYGQQKLPPNRYTAANPLASKLGGK